MAQRLGHALVQQGIGLVYGGGNIGLMGVLASTVLQEGGTVIGRIFPRPPNALIL
jgi:predicted Rossmann-fold nucleotide-binding protein